MRRSRCAHGAGGDPGLGEAGVALLQAGERILGAADLEALVQQFLRRASSL
jgi:hypothetical protein